MKTVYNKKYRLEPNYIDVVISDVESLLRDNYKLSAKEIIRTTYSLSEILLNWMEHNSKATFDIKITQRFKHLDFVVELSDQENAIYCNPLADAEGNDTNNPAGILLSNLGITWIHKFSKGINIVTTSIPYKKTNALVGIFAAIALAIVSILILNNTPTSFSDGAMEYIFNPLFGTFMNALGAIVGPMIFLSVAYGVFSIGSPAMLSTIGKKLFGKWGIQLLIAMVMAIAAIFIFYRPQMSVITGEASNISSIIQIILAIIPSNIIEPFATGNSLQIIFMGVVFGVAMLLLRKNVAEVGTILEQLSSIIQKIMIGIASLLPVLIYVSLVRVGVNEDFSKYMGFIKLILVYLLVAVIYIIYQFVAFKFKTKKSFKETFDILLPSFLVSLATSSSAASFTDVTESLKNKVGIKESLVNFGYPLGVVMFMADNQIWLVLCSYACMAQAGVALTADSLVIIIISAFLLSLAAPPIPGGSITCYTLMLSQLGVPLEYVAVLGVLGIIEDAVGTASHVLANQVQLVSTAIDLDMIENK